MPKLRITTFEAFLTRLNHVSAKSFKYKKERGCVHSKIDQFGIRVLANDAGVVTRSDLISRLGNCARHEDDFFVIPGYGGCESCVAGYGGCGTAGTTGCASVEACVACSCLSSC